MDTVYGPHKDPHGNWMFGNSYFKISKNNFQIGDKTWPLTSGLYGLLFNKIPKNNDAELEIHKQILMISNAHRCNYDSNNQVKGTKAYKYINIIKHLFDSIDERKVGSSLMSFNYNPKDYIYWNDPNELVSPLQLLLASQSTGHNNYNNEIISIIEELKEANLIN